VQFLGTKDPVEPTQTVNAAYQFAATASGGDLQVATRNLTTQAALTLHSRWTDTGAGRGDASYSNPLVTYTQSQCWESASTLFNLVYQVSSPTQPGDTGGDQTVLCAFPSAEPPSITAP
jgi:hypothetical protein